mmetsp:Transcript_39177/g.85231  ORF Transcript_39177/g.85231 Transcript_39177/m.85231 type:complete len:80 (-) Transcript_39177:390-629(-)|eukprot:CAMPEP_0118921336 /NCGR_PEP_ID=MMETSP1169-20130426/660_1 /TAXON_ID=36882 /ORGANISM="Pyramimonas obovata, Strain CCMP722" /LENGTH=79 /DNA_ID=CAMNT_0006862049 /DNA_START=285 /DNA_END=524 /DNA_ORIENTATION=-
MALTLNPYAAEFYPDQGFIYEDDDVFVSEGDESELQTVAEWVEMMAYFEEIETECDESGVMDLKALERSLPLDEASLMS